MFDVSSKYYDTIYSTKNYKTEAEQIHQYITNERQEYKTILDVACGTAQHAFYLKDQYLVDGIDLNPEFISNDIKMCRMTHARRQGNLSILKLDYLFGTDSGIEYFTEEHRMGLFTVNDLIHSFMQAGFEVEYDEHGLIGRGMYIARKMG
ncbi:class I SAM-dependent methyltransferase [Bacillus horti]|uniref:SAM-dependent methyltransferase n=1 Tax=Caldalkalibacillus horti TaxID=77523 RepID=A0ABT9W0M9_9BACI|nr:class I SAM-dependent methyltransferase [Bacillus horti]MDQ0166809.1 SAM-dependent methyltransferase [Bacillus horti]